MEKKTLPQSQAQILKPDYYYFDLFTSNKVYVYEQKKKKQKQKAALL